MPFVSVIIPNYNHARFLDERIQSVLNQTYQNFELIILDDKSTDNSIDVINKYKDDPHVSHVVFNEDNSGSTFKQWGKGFQLAKGDLIWIAESDDSCSPFFLEKLIKLHSAHHSVLVFCRSQSIDTDGRLLMTWHNEINQDNFWEGTAFISNYLGKKNVITNASSVIFEKDLLLKVPREYTNFRGAGDWLFWIELSRRGNVSFCSESLNYFRIHDNNTTSSCYKDGTNFFEGKRINDYLYKERLISREVFKQNVRSNINRILNLNFYPESIKPDLLKLWGYNFSYKVKRFLTMVCNKLIFILWS